MHARAGAKTRLGVRQNTGPLPLAASVRHTAGPVITAALQERPVTTCGCGWTRRVSNLWAAQLSLPEGKADNSETFKPTGSSY